MTVLVADAVTRRYGDAAVVESASLTLRPREVTALLGGSGAGKSTLLRLFAGLEPVDAGEVRLGDDVLSSPARTVPAEKRRIGLIFQDFALFPHLTALQNVAFGLNHLDKAEASDVAANWLDRFGLSGRADAFPHQLSGGEQQRVSIARALAPKPAAILMDEPFSGLDPALRETVRDQALSVVRAAGVPALLVTHDAREAMLAADQLAVMRAGGIVQQGAPEEVYAHPTDLETAAALGPLNRFDARVNEDGRVETPFGALDADYRKVGDRVTVAIREEALRLSPDGAAGEIKAIARIGPLLRIALRTGDNLVFALVPPNDRPKPGQQVGVSVDPSGLFIFGADAD